MPGFSDYQEKITARKAIAENQQALYTKLAAIKFSLFALR